MPRNFRSNKPAGKGRARGQSSGSGRFPKKTEGDSPRSRPSRGGSFGKSPRPPGGRPAPRREREGGGEARTPRYGSFGRPINKGPFGKRSDGPPRSGDEGKGPFRKTGGPGEGRFSPRPDKRRSEGSGDSKRPFRKSAGPGARRFSSDKPQFGRKPGGADFRSKRKFSGPRDDKGDAPRSVGGDRERRGPRKAREGFTSEPKRKDKTFIESRIEKQREDVERSASVPEETKSELIRLNKFISNSGVCSRREADELIKMGVITVNGTTITEMGFKVKITDDVRHDGKRLTAEKPVYLLMNKPKGFITTTDDPQERNTVMQLIANACKERIYPVGRLDRNTTGLLLFTNDGDLADKLTHPSYNVKKIYKVELDKPLTKADHQRIVDGVQLDEGRAMVDDFAVVSDDSKTVGIELHIGWNHVVRRIFDALGYNVVKLDRVVYAGLDKQNLPRGHWRFLTSEEIVRLKHFK